MDPPPPFVVFVSPSDQASTRLQRRMPEQFPSCFGACYSGVASPSEDAGPNLTTSIYETRLGVAALTWSRARALLGLTLAADLCLSDPDEEDSESLRFRVRPWFLWNQRGSRRFSLINDRSSRRCVDFTWDLSRARFCTGSGASSEPASRFFVAISVDSEMLLVAGDLIEEAYKKSRARRPPALLSIPAVPTSRREHVGLGGPGGRRSYRTVARLGGREREISIDLGVKEKDWEEGMAVSIDGKMILHVRRLRWKFRGTEKVEVEGGGWIQVSWDLYGWLFQTKNDSATSSGSSSPLAENQRAMFIFRLEEDQTRNPDVGVHSGNKETTLRNLHGKTTNECRESSSNYGGPGTVRTRQRRNNRSRSLLQKTTSSSSSTSSASSASSSTVLEWASQEEEELQRQDGFSLLVYIWKNSIS